jgi:hypothetical protein
LWANGDEKMIYETNPRKKKIWIKNSIGEITKIKLYRSTRHGLTINLNLFNILNSQELREIADYLDKRNKAHKKT